MNLGGSAHPGFSKIQSLLCCPVHSHQHKTIGFYSRVDNTSLVFSEKSGADLSWGLGKAANCA